MQQKLELAIQTILDALTTVWEDNGNIMAQAMRDNVVMNLQKLTGWTIDEVQLKIEQLVDSAQ